MTLHREPCFRAGLPTDATVVRRGTEDTPILLTGPTPRFHLRWSIYMAVGRRRSVAGNHVILPPRNNFTAAGRLPATRRITGVIYPQREPAH